MKSIFFIVIGALGLLYAQAIVKEINTTVEFGGITVYNNQFFDVAEPEDNLYKEFIKIINEDLKEKREVFAKWREKSRSQRIETQGITPEPRLTPHSTWPTMCYGSDEDIHTGEVLDNVTFYGYPDEVPPCEPEK